MKRYIARQNLFTGLAALALSALFLPQGQTHGQGMRESILIFPSVGLARDQTLRLTLFNSGDEPIRVQARVHAGTILVGLGDASVLPFALHSFDFSRIAIPVEGEAGTSRVQLLLSCETGRHLKVDELDAMMEVIEESSGTTVVAGRDVLLGGSRPDVFSGFVRDMMMGVAP